MQIVTKLHRVAVWGTHVIGQVFGIGAYSVAAFARRRGQSSQEYLSEPTGWKYNESDRKYYPPKATFPQLIEIMHHSGIDQASSR